ncbi:MAG: MFS transporter [Balneola sp.]|nr:MFS transporter [Balneola sp.]|tara:strand:+ start:14542 stop:15948 length:1407 start_codon:yes stop_codon:yes gene_type:complete
MKKERAKISLLEKVGYSAGDGASNLFFQTFVNYLLFFYTDIFGISAAVAGTMFLVTRIFDAVTDPIMGFISDRTMTKYGKFRPYLLWLAIPFGVIGFFMFITPDFSDTGKIVYAYITYTMMMAVYTAINVPYAALMGVITPNSIERTGVSSYRFVAAYLGLLVVTGLTEQFVEFFGNGNEQIGWMWTMGLYGVVAAGLFLFTFFTTKERVLPTKEEKIDLSTDWKDLLANKPWVLIAGATVFQLMYVVIKGGSSPYLVDYYLAEHTVSFFEAIGIGSSKSSFLTSGALATLAGALLTKYIASIFDKKKTYVWSLALSAGFCLPFFFLDQSQDELIYISNIISGFFFGPVSVLQWAIYTDTADFGEWKFGRRATGLIMAASLFALKMGVAIGGALTGWMLAYFDFQPNQVQTEESLYGIIFLAGIISAIAGICGALLMVLYPLDGEKMEQIEVELEARRGELDEPSPTV